MMFNKGSWLESNQRRCGYVVRTVTIQLPGCSPWDRIWTDNDTIVDSKCREHFLHTSFGTLTMFNIWHYNRIYMTDNPKKQPDLYCTVVVIVETDNKKKCWWWTFKNIVSECNLGFWGISSNNLLSGVMVGFRCLAQGHLSRVYARRQWMSLEPGFSGWMTVSLTTGTSCHLSLQYFGSSASNPCQWFQAAAFDDPKNVKRYISPYHNQI